MFDYPTLLTVTMFVSGVAGIMLLFSWQQNRSIEALGLWGAAYCLNTVGMTLLMITREQNSLWLPLAGYPLWIVAHGLMWKAARSFEGRDTPVHWVLAGAGLWLTACLIEGFYQSTAARIMLASGIVGVYLLLSAMEIRRGALREDLASRWPAVILLVVHGIIFIGRVPFVQVLPFPGGIQPPPPGWIPTGIFELMFHFFCMSVLLVNMAKERAELMQRRNSLIDPLTGVANRRAFTLQGERLIEAARARGRSASLLVFDLDRFKSINDTFGHQAGDAVLSRFCDAAVAAGRPGDLFGRIGGEEFACLMIGASLREATQAAEHIRMAFAGTPVTVGQSGTGQDILATASAGVAIDGDSSGTLDRLFMAADRALYRAKDKGRNCVEAERPQLQLVPVSVA